MRVTVDELTTDDLIRRACQMTIQPGMSAGRVDLAKLYQAEHSPIRCKLFWIEMHDIPTFVSVHFVRHKVGVEHFVRSNREDRGGDGKADRWSLVNHAMLANAQALINMARKRLCANAHVETQAVMFAVWSKIAGGWPELADAMTPECEYRGRCVELRPCGRMQK